MFEINILIQILYVSYRKSFLIKLCIAGDSQTLNIHAKIIVLREDRNHDTSRTVRLTCLPNPLG